MAFKFAAVVSVALAGVEAHLGDYYYQWDFSETGQITKAKSAINFGKAMKACSSGNPMWILTPKCMWKNFGTGWQGWKAPGQKDGGKKPNFLKEKLCKLQVMQYWEKGGNTKPIKNCAAYENTVSDFNPEIADNLHKAVYACRMFTFDYQGRWSQSNYNIYVKTPNCEEQFFTSNVNGEERSYWPLTGTCLGEVKALWTHGYRTSAHCDNSDIATVTDTKGYFRAREGQRPTAKWWWQ